MTKPKRKAVAIVSGGLDSVTLAYFLADGYDLHMLTFNYGQRHKKELDYARKCATALDCRHDEIDLSSVGDLLKGSSLTDMTIPVPDGHYQAENMKSTVVPNRNAIMLAIAYGVAVSEGAEVVSIGVHSGDHHIYPDCRPGFIKAFETMEFTANDGGPVLYAPFISKSKADIVKLGWMIDVPFEDTWSCYKGGGIHCGTCGTCVERKEAFEIAQIDDPTEYEV